jgi:anti-anti-sigma factor
MVDVANRLIYSIERISEGAVVHCRGRLVAGETDRFQLDVRPLIASGSCLILDFAELSHIDSAGIGALARLYVSCRSVGCPLQLDHVGKPVRQLLGITHMLSVLTIIGEKNIRMV